MQVLLFDSKAYRKKKARPSIMSEFVPFPKEKDCLEIVDFVPQRKVIF